MALTEVVVGSSSCCAEMWLGVPSAAQGSTSHNLNASHLCASYSFDSAFYAFSLISSDRDLSLD
jgi:hypothetical protein